VSIGSTDYALLAQESYHDRGLYKQFDLGGVTYQAVDHADNPRNGFQATAYERMDTHEVVIAYRGTEFNREPLQDGLVDAGMAFDGVNAQTPDAMAFTQHVMEKAKERADTNNYPLSVTVTGHSLGGTLAEINACKFGLHGETFNAYGAAGLSLGIPQGGNQVIDHVRATDVVSAASAHFGEVRTYAVQQDIDALTGSGYHDSGMLNTLMPHTPILGKIQGDAHAIDNFVPDSKLLGQSIITPENEKRYTAHHEMIDRYRGDIAVARDVAFVGYQVQKPIVETTIKGAKALDHAGHEVVHGAEQAYGMAREKVIEGAHATERAAQYVGHEAAQAYDATRGKVIEGAHATERAAQYVGHEAAQAYDATRGKVIEGAQAAERTAHQAYDATRHAVTHELQVVGQAATEAAHGASEALHAAGDKASQAFDTLAHPGSWFDGNPAAPTVAAHAPGRLDDPSHAGYGMFQQARGAVHQLDAEHNRTPDQRSDNLAAALTVAARGEGMQRIDHVALSSDSSRAFAIEGDLRSFTKQMAHVETAQAVGTSVAHSSAAWEHAAPQKQTQATVDPQDQRAQQPAHSSTQR
jgi:hypothetical protein